MPDWYSASGDPADDSDLESDVVRAEFTAIAAAFAKLAGYTGLGTRVPFVNAGGTAQSTDSAFTYNATTDVLTVNTSTFGLNTSIAGTLGVTGALTYGGVALTAAVTGTGKMVLDTSPTIATPVINSAAHVGGTWVADATWTLPALTLGGTVSGGGQQLNNIIIGTSTPLAGAFTTLSSTGTATLNDATFGGGYGVTGVTISAAGAISADGNLIAAANVNAAAGGGIFIIGTLSSTTDVSNKAHIVADLDGTSISQAIGQLRIGKLNTADGQFRLAWDSTNNRAIMTAGRSGVAYDPIYISSGVITMDNYGAGTATFSSAGVISSVSDETWKIKEGRPDDPIAMLMGLEPGYYRWRDVKLMGPQRELGHYAQNVHTAIGEEAAPTPQEGKPWGFYDRSVAAVHTLAMQNHEARLAAVESKIRSLA